MSEPPMWFKLWADGMNDWEVRKNRKILVTKIRVLGWRKKKIIVTMKEATWPTGIHPDNRRKK